jgi:transposase
MVNLQPQRTKRARYDRGRRRPPAFLPLCSPDFNSIEKAFSKLKALLGKAAERTLEASGQQSADCSTRSRQKERVAASISGDPTRLLRSGAMGA